MTTQVQWDYAADKGVSFSKIVSALSKLEFNQAFLLITYEKLMKKVSDTIGKVSYKINKDSQALLAAQKYAGISDSLSSIGLILSAIPMLFGVLGGLYDANLVENPEGIIGKIKSTINKMTGGIAQSAMKMMIYAQIMGNLTKAVSGLLEGNFNSKNQAERTMTDGLEFVLKLTTNSANNSISKVMKDVGNAIQKGLENNFRAESVQVNKGK